MPESFLDFDAYIIDLDGVVTDTASLHARAWKRLFDGLLVNRELFNGNEPFRIGEDYALHVRGLGHHDAIRKFLASRNIVLPDGSPEDPEDAVTVNGLARRKSAIFKTMVEERGINVFAGSSRFLDHLQSLGRPTALVTSSRNGALVLERAGLGHRFDVVVDGRVLEHQRLAPQPAPEGFLFAAAWLGVEPAWTVVIEATAAGVTAARHGDFGCVVGVLRGNSRAALRAAGADVVVDDLAELL
jgi:beta-phosphoglucomutase-like phosphatase (HAD superfamily)